jgi:hypothetical protein
MNASSEAAFYLIELAKVAVPTSGIAFVLVAAIRRYRTSPSRSLAVLCAITAIWLLVTLANRVALSGPILKKFIFLGLHAEGPSEPLYLEITNWLWTADEVILLLFGVTLFVVWRGDRIHLTSRSSQPPAVPTV